MAVVMDSELETPEVMKGESEDGKEKEAPTDERLTRAYWAKWIKCAKKSAEQHWEDARAASEEFDNKPTPNSRTGSSYTSRSSTVRDQLGNSLANPRPYPIYKSSCQILAAAFYSRTPIFKAERKFGIADDLGGVMCKIAESVTKDLCKPSSFDSVMQSVVYNFIHAAKAAPQIVYDANKIKKPCKVKLTKKGENVYHGPDGQEFKDEVFKKEGTEEYFGNGEEEAVDEDSQRIYPKQLSYNKILHTPDAESEDDITDKAYWFSMTEMEARQRFCDCADEIAWKATKGEKDDDSSNDENPELPGKYLEGWEIYCKPLKKVLWYSDQYPGGFLDEKDDFLKLPDFFPSPRFILMNKPLNDCYPTPAYIDLKPYCDQLHELARRTFSLLDAARIKALVDADENVINALNQPGENIYAKVANLQSILEKGGIEKLICFIPIKQFLDSATNLIQVEEQFKNNFFEWFHVPDILRGASDPVETAAAQEIKVSAAHDTFKMMKRQIRECASEIGQMMLDVAMSVYSDIKIQKICGFEYWSEQEKGLFDAAMEKLRNVAERIVSITVEADSLSFLDEQLKQAEIERVSGVINQALANIAQMKDNPEYIPITLQLLLSVLEASNVGKQFQENVKKSINILQQKLANPPQTPPPPDYEQMKIDLSRNKQQIEAQVSARELSQKDFKLQLQEQKQNGDAQIAQFKASMEKVVQNFMMQIEQQNTQIEGFKAQMQARESQMEEIRLAREADQNSWKEAQATAATTEPGLPAQPQIIALQQPTPPAPKLLQVKADMMGNPTVTEVPTTTPTI